eukprot:scaffold53_cov193-Pinguiococcus_pyrenoidosus.AAC.68
MDPPASDANYGSHKLANLVALASHGGGEGAARGVEAEALGGLRRCDHAIRRRRTSAGETGLTPSEHRESRF